MKPELEQTGLDAFAKARSELLEALQSRITLHPLVPETELTEQLGISRDAIRALRKKELTEGIDWTGKNKRIQYTQEAALRIISLAVGSLTSPEEKKEGGGDPGREAGPEELTVVSIARRNVHMLDARKKDGAMVRVKVRSNLNFIPGMVINARPGGEWPDVYVLEGRAPRYRGRW